MNKKNFWLTDKPIDLEVVKAKVVRPEAGAVAMFTGIAREFTNGKRTLFLEYQAYVSMAEKMLAQVGEEIKEQWGNVDVAIAHRTRSEEHTSELQSRGQLVCRL